MSLGDGYQDRTTQEVLDRLDRVRATSRGWSACCPAHPDRTPSLSVAEGDTCVLVKCWAGCELDEIAAAMGLRVSDLFYRPLSGQRSRKRTARSVIKRIDWRRQAAALEDEAITLWLHANEVFAFACNLDTTAWTDEDWDTATEAVCGAYENRERAEAPARKPKDARPKCKCRADQSRRCRGKADVDIGCNGGTVWDALTTTSTRAVFDRR